MNDNIANRIQCPFYVAHNSGTGNNITITCERIKTNMGFNVKNKLFFANQKQRLDFMELFLSAAVLKQGGELDLTMEDIGNVNGKYIEGQILDGSDGKIYRYIVQSGEKL